MIKRNCLLIALLLIPLLTFGQKKTEVQLSLSYFGEMITHPGLRIGMNIPINEWGDTKQNHFDIGPSVGLFYHKRYQTGYFFINDFAYRRSSEKNRCMAAGVGIGFLNAQVPNAFLSLQDGSVYKLGASHWYILVNLFTCFNKEIKLKNDKTLDLFIKPQYMIAYPNFPVSLGYLALEVGVRQNITIGK